MDRRRAIAAFCLLLATLPGATAAAAPPDARAGAIGLLQLPDVYGTEPCQRFRPAPVRVHPQPGATAVLGEIRTARHWTYPPEGGCTGLRVEFVPTGGQGRELPAQEFAAEQPAAIVLEQRGDWYRVRLPDGSGWLHAMPRDDYGPLLALLRRDLDGFTDRAGTTLRREPSAAAEVIWSGVPECAVPRVRDSREATGPGTWLEVEFERDPCCADDAPVLPAEPVRGWVPLYRADGVPSVWFAARGC